MELAQQAFTTAFPDFSVTLSSNPDHSLELVLRDHDNVVRRVIPAGETRSHGYLEKWISAIRRDLAQEQGDGSTGTPGYNPFLAVLPRYARH